MKNKFTITMVCIISAFFIGKNVGAAGSMDKNHIDPAEIVDWNTDGKELSISTADGYEYYAYKKKTCYEKVNKKRQERILAEKMAISCNQKQSNHFIERSPSRLLFSGNGFWNYILILK